MATPNIPDFEGNQRMNLRSSKRAKLVHAPYEEPAESNRGTGSQSSAALEKGKHRASSFHFFKDIPLDILGEVFRDLEPLDLLHLSWTDTILRSFLSNRASIAFWRRSLATVEDLPPCPTDLTEPQYTALMLTDYCHACLGGSKTLFMYLEARTQLCRQCSCEEFKRWNHLPKQIDESLIDIIPATCQSLTAKERKEHTKAKRVERTRFHVQTALKLDEEWRKLRSKKQKAIWLTEKEAEWKEIEKHAAACERYILHQAQKQKEWKRNLPHRREDSIREKLIEEGWGNEIQLTPYFLKEQFWHLLRKSQEFTDQEWDQIKETVIAKLQRRSAVRLLRQKRSRLFEQTRLLIAPAYMAHILSQLPNTIIPSFGELLMTQDFLPIAELASLGQTIPAAMLGAALRKIPEIFTNWRRDQDESLLDIVRQSPAYSGQQVPEAALRYATTIFHCTRCVSGLTYPAVLFHECLMTSCSQFHWTDQTLNYQQSEAILSALDPNTVSTANLVRFAHGAPRATPFSLFPPEGSLSAPSEVLQFHTAAYYHTAAILDSLRMDRTTSAKALHKLNPYMKARCECYEIDQDWYGGKSIRWMEATAGCRLHRSGNYDDSFSPLDEEEISRLPKSRTFIGPSMDQSHLGWKRCLLCHVSVQDFGSDAELEEHLRFGHYFSADDAQNFTANYEPCYLLS